jgi:hypothetical protein
MTGYRWFILWDRRRMLLRDAASLLKSETGSSWDARIWFAAVEDFLKSTLPATSAVYREFEALNASVRGKGEAPPTDQPSKGTPQSGEIASPEARDLRKTIEATTRLLKSVSLSTTRSMQSDLGSDGEADKAQRENLEHDIRSVINDTFAHSWAFRVPIVVMSAAVIFAVFGIFQIQNYRVDIRDLRDKAIDKAKQQIDSQAVDLRKNLQRDYDSTSKAITSTANIAALSQQYRSASSEITKAANSEALQRQSGSASDDIRRTVASHIEKLKSEKSAALETNLSNLAGRIHDLETRFKPLDAQVSTFERRLVPVASAYEEIKSNKDRRLLEVASVVLNGGVVFVWTILTISVIALLLAFATWWNGETRAGFESRTLLARFCGLVSIFAGVTLAGCLLGNWPANPAAGDIVGQMIAISLQLAAVLVMIGLGVDAFELQSPVGLRLVLIIALILIALILVENDVLARLIQREKVQQITSMAPVALGALLSLLCAWIVSVLAFLRSPSKYWRWIGILVLIVEGMTLLGWLAVGAYSLFVAAVLVSTAAVVGLGFAGWRRKLPHLAHSLG